VSLDEEIKKAIKNARKAEKVRHSEEENKRKEKSEIASNYFRTISNLLRVVKQEFIESQNIIFKIEDYETSYADIDLKTERNLYRIAISCVPFEEGENYRISYLVDVRCVYSDTEDDIEYYHHYFEQGKESALLKKAISIITRFENRGLLTALDCE